MKSMSRHEQHEKHGEREADSDGGIDTPTRRTGTAMPDRRAMETSAKSHRPADRHSRHHSAARRRKPAEDMTRASGSVARGRVSFKLRRTAETDYLEA